MKDNKMFIEKATRVSDIFRELADVLDRPETKYKFRESLDDCGNVKTVGDHLMELVVKGRSLCHVLLPKEQAMLVSKARCLDMVRIGKEVAGDLDAHPRGEGRVLASRVRYIVSFLEAAAKKLPGKSGLPRKRTVR